MTKPQTHENLKAPRRKKKLCRNIDTIDPKVGLRSPVALVKGQSEKILILQKHQNLNAKSCLKTVWLIEPTEKCFRN